MRILVVGGGDPQSVKTWSGTPYIIIKELERRGYDVFSYDVFKPLYKVNLLLRLLARFIFLRRSTRYPGLKMVYNHGLKRVLSQRKYDCILYISEYADYKTDIPSFAYVDAVLEPLLQYYPYKRVTHRLFFNHFYKGFKKNDIHATFLLNGIFTQSNWVKQYFENEYNVDSAKINKIGFGVNLTPLESEKSYDENLLLIVLRKGYECIKGLDLLLNAFRMLRAEDSSVNLAVVGTELTAEEGVTYYYNQSREVTVHLFQKCTLYTMPAICEPNGITYLEALANKAPIVGLDRFAFPEFAGFGKYGFICKKEDPKILANLLKDALNDKNRLKKMGEEGQKYVMENFVWKKTICNMIDIIETNIGKK